MFSSITKRKARFCSTNSLLEYKVLFSICWLATNLMCYFFRSWLFLLTGTKLDLTLFLIRHLLRMQYNHSRIWVSRLLRLVLEVQTGSSWQLQSPTPMIFCSLKIFQNFYLSSGQPLAGAVEVCNHNRKQDTKGGEPNFAWLISYEARRNQNQNKFLCLLIACTHHFPRVKTGWPDHGRISHFDNKIGFSEEFLVKNHLQQQHLTLFLKEQHYKKMTNHSTANRGWWYNQNKN